MDLLLVPCRYAEKKIDILRSGKIFTILMGNTHFLIFMSSDIKYNNTISFQYIYSQNFEVLYYYPLICPSLLCFFDMFNPVLNTH